MYIETSNQLIDRLDDDTIITSRQWQLFSYVFFPNMTNATAGGGN
jgi:hypothetical protein